MVQFCYLRLYLGTETFSMLCFLCYAFKIIFLVRPPPPPRNIHWSSVNPLSHRDYLIIWVVSSTSIFWDNRDHSDDYGGTRGLS